MTGSLDWASHSCPLTFTTLGVWAAGGEVTSVSRSGGLVAAGEEGGKVRLNIAPVIHNSLLSLCCCQVRLYRWPASQVRAEARELEGHSGHVTAVQFLDTDTATLVTAGGRETSLMQWAA